MCILVGSGERLQYTHSQSFMLPHLMNAIANLSNVKSAPIGWWVSYKSRIEQIPSA